MDERRFQFNRNAFLPRRRTQDIVSLSATNTAIDSSASPTVFRKFGTVDAPPINSFAKCANGSVIETNLNETNSLNAIKSRSISPIALIDQSKSIVGFESRKMPNVDDERNIDSRQSNNQHHHHRTLLNNHHHHSQSNDTHSMIVSSSPISIRRRTIVDDRKSPTVLNRTFSINSTCSTNSAFQPPPSTKEQHSPTAVSSVRSPPVKTWFSSSVDGFPKPSSSSTTKTGCGDNQASINNCQQQSPLTTNGNIPTITPPSTPPSRQQSIIDNECRTTNSIVTSTIRQLQPSMNRRCVRPVSDYSLSGASKPSSIPSIISSTLSLNDDESSTLKSNATITTTGVSATLPYRIHHRACPSIQSIDSGCYSPDSRKNSVQDEHRPNRSSMSSSTDDSFSDYCIGCDSEDIDTISRSKKKTDEATSVVDVANL